MQASDFVSSLGLCKDVVVHEATAFASANIALIKYWGKRNEALHLPTHGSVSLSLGPLGSTTKLSFDKELSNHEISINKRKLLPEDTSYQQINRYLNLFRPSENGSYRLISSNSVPTAAGLASSASGYAAAAKALNELHGWNLNTRELSILARLGSGSATRSLFSGFALWHAGTLADGRDCYAEDLKLQWPQLRWAVALLNDEPKAMSSRLAMKVCQETCGWFSRFVELSKGQLAQALEAIQDRAFARLGELMELSALSMHAAMMGSSPSILYWGADTVRVMQCVQHLRGQGMACYFTIDAGPNVKILYQQSQENELRYALENLDVKWLWVNPWQF